MKVVRGTTSIGYKSLFISFLLLFTVKNKWLSVIRKFFGAVFVLSIPRALFFPFNREAGLLLNDTFKFSYNGDDVNDTRSGSIIYKSAGNA